MSLIKELITWIFEINTILKLFFCSLFVLSCAWAHDNTTPVKLVILGIAQDAGYPQINCYKPHCMPAWKDSSLKRMATSLAIIDEQNKQKILFEATPDMPQQLYQLQTLAADNDYPLAGIFLTHAHMGHYTGLMHLGREAAGSNGVNVYAMPRMHQFLSTNAPWSQLINLNNIKLNKLQSQQSLKLNSNISITPILVPHRDEFSETVGYKIKGPNKTVLFIPDIDKWQKWDHDIVEEIKKVDYALLDATFYQNGEIPNRDMSEIPHPFVTESMRLFSQLSQNDKAKIIFIHFNHTNPLLQDGSEAQKEVLNKGFGIAFEGLQLVL